MSIISVCVFGIFTALTVLILKSKNKEIASVLVIAAFVMIFAAFLPTISSLFDTIKEFSEMANVKSEYISVLIKTLGICYIAQFSSDICKENESQSISSQIELSAKLIILLLAMPIYNDIITIIFEFLT